ncbi:MAG: L,D-transpeptidase, partial [Myxococcota bacterium]
EFDRAQAARQGRTRLGGDIFIHGKAASIGCVAIGDRAIEDVFVLVGDVGYERAEVWIAPVDWREDVGADVEGAPAWMEPVYAELREKMRALPSAR